jgi:hypothetical protein
VVGKYLNAFATVCKHHLRLIDNLETAMKVSTRESARFIIVGAAAGILIAGTVCLITSRPAEATPKFATDTGKACGECHVNPAGGGKLTSFGEAFKANGNKLP